ncbi:MAG: hypothetical protein GF311_27750 [Candidatus Lokiarchaeota archaeon]|nr:hypothetical protein [Candidatus Lokiarchaeota archaeon]
MPAAGATQALRLFGNPLVSINLNNEIIAAAERQERERPAPEEEYNAAAKDSRMKNKSKTKDLPVLNAQ